MILKTEIYNLKDYLITKSNIYEKTFGTSGTIGTFILIY